MNARLATIALLAFLPGAGCTTDRSTAPSTPLESAPVLSFGGVEPCDFTQVHYLSYAYFRPAEFLTAKRFIRAMIAAGPRTTGARAAGFDLMALIAHVVEAGLAGPPYKGSALTNELIECMFAPADFPAAFPVDFTQELDPNQDGAYDVRRPEPDDAPVLARGAFAFSGVAPPAGTLWEQILDEPVLIYGQRTGPEAYEWSMVRPGASFDPPAVVGVCVESFGTVMLSEENVGILAFVDPTYFLACPNLLASGTPPGPERPFARLTRLATRLLGPSPLHAATLNPGGTGGLAGGLRSIFEPLDLTTVGNVVLAFTVQPVDGEKGVTLALVQVSATTGEGTPVAGVEVSFRAVNNNGRPVVLGGTTTQTTGAGGLASFTDLSLNKTGAYRLIASGTVLGRPGIPVAGVVSQKFNVRPRH